MHYLFSKWFLLDVLSIAPSLVDFRVFAQSSIKGDHSNGTARIGLDEDLVNAILVLRIVRVSRCVGGCWLPGASKSQLRTTLVEKKHEPAQMQLVLEASSREIYGGVWLIENICVA